MPDASRSIAQQRAEPADVVTAEVAEIVIRARELGFSPERVAIALGVSPRSLASIDLPAPADRRHS